MKHVIEKLENQIKEMGLEVVEKKQTDLMYIISVQFHGKGNFVIFTKQKLCKENVEKCFFAYQVTQHVPFDIVTQEKIEDFFWYIESYFLERDLKFGPINKEKEEAFLSIYLKEISKRRIDHYKYWFNSGISHEEVINRMMTAVSIM